MFKLSIECSRDIHELRINFSDGTCVSSDGFDCNTKKETVNSSPELEELRTPNKREKYLDTEAESEEISQDIVQLPNIVQKSRPVNVAPELQNFDF